MGLDEFMYHIKRKVRKKTDQGTPTRLVETNNCTTNYVATELCEPGLDVVHLVGPFLTLSDPDFSLAKYVHKSLICLKHTISVVLSS
jgi:hypothetical protein